MNKNKCLTVCKVIWFCNFQREIIFIQPYQPYNLYYHTQLLMVPKIVHLKQSMRGEKEALVKRLKI